MSEQRRVRTGKLSSEQRGAAGRRPQGGRGAGEGAEGGSRPLGALFIHTHPEPQGGKKFSADVICYTKALSDGSS